MFHDSVNQSFDQPLEYVLLVHSTRWLLKNHSALLSLEEGMLWLVSEFSELAVYTYILSVTQELIPGCAFLRYSFPWSQIPEINYHCLFLWV